MCLEKAGERLIAKQAITCYKRLLVQPTLKRDMLPFHGVAAKAIVNDRKYNVTISVKESNVHLCSDNETLDRNRCDERFGHRYSWMVDNYVTSIKHDGEELMDCSSLRTPYRLMVVEIKKTYESSLVKDEEELTVSVGLHSFATLGGAKDDGAGTIVKCTIPKGSHYYEGTFDGHVSYASTKLTYVKIVQ